MQQRHPLADDHPAAYLLIDVFSIVSKADTVDEVTLKFDRHDKNTAATVRFRCMTYRMKLENITIKDVSTDPGVLGLGLCVDKPILHVA